MLEKMVSWSKGVPSCRILHDWRILLVMQIVIAIVCRIVLALLIHILLKLGA